MAAHPPAGSTSPVSGPSLPKRRNTSDGSGSSTALRNSCEACASSKVRCTGGRPKCSRCQKRGFECEYFHAKRAGRKPAGSANAASNNGSGGSSAVGGGSAAGGGGPPQPANQADTMQDSATISGAPYASPRGSASELSDIWSDLNPLDGSLFPDMSNINETSSGFTPFQMQLPALDAAAPIAPMLSSNTHYSSAAGSDLFLDLADMSAAALEASNSSAADLFAFPLSTPGPTTIPTPVTSGSSTLERSPAKSKSCSCLVQALGLLKRLSELMCATDAAWATQRNADAVRTIDDILQQNKAGIDTATGMLTCPGRHDGYLLIIVCLTAFKTIEILRAVLPGAPSSSPGQPTMARRFSVPATIDTASQRGDWARRSTQAMLSELHGVRGLTKMLSDRLQVQANATAPSSTTSSTTATTPDCPADGLSLSKHAIVSDIECRLPFSAEVYRQLDTDLNNRVKALSQQMIQRLRKF